MGEIIPFRKNGDQTPRSFAPEDWRDAIARGGYWSALLGYFVPVRMVSEEEFWAHSLLPEILGGRHLPTVLAGHSEIRRLLSLALSQASGKFS